jgi:3-oxoacyl-[acyl-carrier-protein] synthase II
MFITAASTISYQHTFRNKGFSAAPVEINDSSNLITPDYSGFIAAMDKRRMSHVQKMSIACAMDCVQQANIEQPDAIIVGTSMGCSLNTKNFLDKILDAKEGPLSPTSFIVSTHNTIAGQIALLMKNHGYNMTHTQNSLSFEQGLLDAMLCCGEGLTNVLVGGTDEEEDSIYNMRARLRNDQIRLTSGASFFLVSNINNEFGAVNMIDVGSFGLVKNSHQSMLSFLESNKTNLKELDLVLYSISDENRLNDLRSVFGDDRLFDYQQVAGTYYTNAAFAMHYAIDILCKQPHPIFGEIKTVLVYNNLIPENLGLVLLEKKN